MNLDIDHHFSEPRYSTLCQWPERIHDHFRDALYHSPLAHAASQLMDGADVRVMNTIVMGSAPHNTIPKVRLINFFSVF